MNSGYDPRYDYPTGPGGRDVRGRDPRPDDSIEQRILLQTARKAGMGLMPVAELIPTDTVPLNLQLVPSGGTPTSGAQFQFPCDGIAVGLRCTCASAVDGSAVNDASVLVRVQIDGTMELFPSASGTGPGYLPLSMVSGNAANFSMGIYRFRSEFKQANRWAVYFANRLGVNVNVDVAIDIIRTTNLRIGG